MTTNGTGNVNRVDNWARANAKYITKCYDDAIVLYTACIEDDQKSAGILNPSYRDAVPLAMRARCYAKTKQFALAAKDASLHLTSVPHDRKMRYQRSIWYYRMGMYREALDGFVECVFPDIKSDLLLDAWIEQSRSALLSTQSIPSDQTLPSNDNVDMNQKPSTLECDQDPDATSIAEPVTVTANDQDFNGLIRSKEIGIVPNERALRAKSNVTNTDKARYTWYQTSATVVVTVFSRQRKQEDVNVTFGTQSLEVDVDLDSGTQFSLDLDLFDRIDTENCVCEILSTKIGMHIFFYLVIYSNYVQHC